MHVLLPSLTGLRILLIYVCPPPGLLSAMDLPLLASYGVPRLLARVASV